MLSDIVSVAKGMSINVVFLTVLIYIGNFMGLEISIAHCVYAAAIVGFCIEAIKFRLEGQ